LAAAEFGRYVPSREFNEATAVMKNILLILVMALLPGCSSVSTYKTSSVDLSRSPAVFLRIQKDTENFSGNISQRVESLGFKVTKDPSRADYYAEVEYATFFDVVHQTFKHFEIILVDAKTNENKIRSRYVGRFGFNGCDAALDLVFKDLSRKLKNGT
jgi:hypothetical protein